MKYICKWKYLYLCINTGDYFLKDGNLYFDSYISTESFFFNHDASHILIYKTVHFLKSLRESINIRWSNFLISMGIYFLYSYQYSVYFFNLYGNLFFVILRSPYFN
jgi:hypothetical protein